MRHPSVRCFSNVAYETVPMFMWLIIALSRPFKEDRLALPLSTPLSSRQSMVLCPWLWTIIGGSSHRYYFCRDKHVFFATNFFSPQNISRDKNDTCGSSRQWYTFVASKDVFVATKMILVAALANDILLSRQKTCLSRQNLYLWQFPPMILNTSDLPRSKPLVRAALPASLSARSFPFTPVCPGQYTNRSFGRWMSTVDTFQSGLNSITLFTVCSKLIDSWGWCHVWSDCHLLKDKSKVRGDFWYDFR